jgi:hypothetical protein
VSEGLGFLDPGNPKALKRLDRLSRGILHALENDQSIAPGVMMRSCRILKSGADAKALYF